MASKDCVTALDKIGNNFQTLPEGKATEIAEPQINGGVASDNISRCHTR